MEPTKKAERSLKRLLKAADDFSRDVRAIKPRRKKPDEAELRARETVKASEHDGAADA